jgi:predicted transcriptional regulator
MDTKVLTTHVPLPLAEKLDQIASRIDRSRGWIMKQALTDWIAIEEERRRLTIEAFSDVDVGNVIDHSDVQAWANSLDSDQPPRVSDSR